MNDSLTVCLVGSRSAAGGAGVKMSGPLVVMVLLGAGVMALGCTATPRNDDVTTFGRQAATAPSLGSAAGFAVLAAASVTSTGATVLTGDLGVAPGTAITGFPPGVVNGTIHTSDAVALQAEADASSAFDALSGEPCDLSLTGMDLGGLTLTAGTYCFESSAQLTGALTLDAQGNPDAVFVFQMGSTLTTASGSTVSVINGADQCNVFWQVGSSATLGTATSFVGTILARTSITMTTAASLVGRALALDASVTMDTSSVSADSCQVSVGSTTVASATVGAGGAGGEDSSTTDTSAGVGGQGGAGPVGVTVGVTAGVTVGGGEGGDGGGSAEATAGVGGQGGDDASTSVAETSAGAGGSDGHGGGEAGVGGHPGEGGSAGEGGSTGEGGGDGSTVCDGICVDLQVDAHNCGACGHVCEALEACIDGACCTE